MKYHLQNIVFASSLLWPFDASAGAPFPSEVQAYIEKRDTCDHFRGEHGGTKEREIQVAQEEEKYCRGTDKELKTLRIRYTKDEKVIKALSVYDECIEGDCP